EKPDLVRRLVLSVTSGGIDVASLGATDWRPSFVAKNPGLPRWFVDERHDERHDLTARIREIAIPVLLLWGDADPIGPVPAGRRLAELFPDSRLVVLPGGTHDLILERADEVIPHIECHLSA